jgi:catechol 2,3-dioxygenase-like lactoylglutathione lyase family enzyme
MTESRQISVQGIDHVAIWVRDVAASVAWYRDLLGLERRYQEAWGDHPAVVGVGTTSIALFPVGSGSPNPRPTSDTLAMSHLAFRADRTQFETAQEALADRGVEYETTDHGVAHSIYFNDPDGHRLEITTYELT